MRKDPSNLRQRTVVGVAWSGAGRLGQQGIHFVISILLARLLLPEHFGLIAMLMVFIGFASLFAEFGFAAALVYEPDLGEAEVNSTFWLNVGVGVALTAVFMLLAPAIARFYSVPELGPMGRVIAFTFTLSALGIVPGALLKRQMAFRSLALVEMAATLAAGGAAVVLALSGAGVWTLVAHSLLLALLTSALTWRVAAWRPRLSFSMAGMRSVLRFSANLFGFNMVNYWARNADNLLIGKFLGSTGLGIYNRAYALMLLPSRQLATVLGRVMFPALASIQEDHTRVRRADRKSVV